ncbi:MAG TPA: hypothetical protein VMK84_15750 [Streptosporangiaceae bacterium]|nr:hypothetical protein [Streptosporangiaceae bacterium]
MQTWDAITSRRNVRSFADRPIPASASPAGGRSARSCTAVASAARSPTTSPCPRTARIFSCG